MDPPIFISSLPGGSVKTRPTGHRRGGPPRTDCEHSLQNFLLSLYDGRRRGRPPRPVLLPWLHQPKGHRRGRPPNNYPRLETDPVSTIFFISFRKIHACFLHDLLLLDNNVYPQSKPHSTFFKGGRCRQRSIYLYATFVLGIHFCPFITILM